MTKVYVLSSHPDVEVSDTINKMPADKLRVALYGIARGYDFDESMDVAIFDGTKTTWLSSLEAAQQTLALDLALPPAKDDVYKIEWLDGDTVRLTPSQ